MLEVDPIQSEPEPVEGDPVPCPEDEEFFVRPDAGDMEEAIDKFLDGLDGQERSGFEEMHRFLATLPIPSAKESRSMTHAEAIQGQFLPDMDEEQRKRFTPSELIMYKHALEHRYLYKVIVYIGICMYIAVYTCIYVYIHDTLTLFTDGPTLSSKPSLLCFVTRSSTARKWTLTCTRECKRL